MTVRGADQLMKQLRQLPIDARVGIGRALAVSVMDLDRYAKEKLQGGGRSGRTYARGKRGVHQASAPGEFPKSDYGQLVKSLFFRVGADKLTAYFGTKLAYGKHLELGTSRMAARPWMRPTLKANTDAITARIRAAVNEALKRPRG